MSEQRHVIKRQVLEVHLGQAQDARWLQAEVSRIYRQRIVPLVDQYCTEFSTPDRIHRIESLDLNLGQVDVENLEDDLVAKVRTQLRQLLADQIRQQEQVAERSNTSLKTTSQLELFSLFAQTGSLPWWVDASQPHLLEGCLQHLERAAPASLRQLMRSLAQDRLALQRIAQHYPDSTLSDLAKVLAPSAQLSSFQLPSFAFFVQELIAVLAQAPPLASRQQSQLRKSVWAVTIHMLSLGGEASQEVLPFYKAMFMRVARQLGVGYATLLSAIQEVVQGSSESSQSQFRQTVKILFQALPSQRTAAEQDKAEQAGEPHPIIRSLLGLFAVLCEMARQLPAHSRADVWAALNQLERTTVDRGSFQSLLSLLQAALQQHRFAPERVRQWRATLQRAATAGLAPTELMTLSQLLRTAQPESAAQANADTEAEALPGEPPTASSSLRLLAVVREIVTYLPNQDRAQVAATLDQLEHMPATHASLQPVVSALRSVLAHHRLPLTQLQQWRARLEQITAREPTPAGGSSLIDLLSTAEQAALDSVVSEAEAVEESPLLGVVSVLGEMARQLPADRRAAVLAALDQLEHTPAAHASLQPAMSALRSVLAHHRLPLTQLQQWRARLERLTSREPTPAGVSSLIDLLSTAEQAALESAVSEAEAVEESSLLGVVSVLGEMARQLPADRRAAVLAALDHLERMTPDCAALSQLLSLLQPALERHRFPPAAVQQWVTELQRLAGAGLAPELAQQLADLTELVARLSTELPDSSSPEGLTAQPQAEASPLEPLELLDLGFSDADELYINNAGLVIVWPFLSHFFARLGLLEDKRFADSAARHRAAGLLQYLVTEDPIPPEYLLGLNKVLCGMELSEVFDFGPPVSATEAEECTNLLTAVIGQAPILNNMSVGGFRRTFLLRPGVLSSRDGAWLLRVERETYDIVLDRFPWSLEWVKLPWMETMLRVEW